MRLRSLSIIMKVKTMARYGLANLKRRLAISRLGSLRNLSITLIESKVNNVDMLKVNTLT